MLTNLQIKNFTIIDELNLQFTAGTTVFSGETGAGKSVIIDALALVLGERADSTVLKPNTERCDIIADFDITKLENVKNWLQTHALNSEDECILRRSIFSNGRSQAFINDQSCSLQSLRQLGSLLITIHGQHENQNLLKSDFQRQLVDDFAGHQHLRENVRTVFLSWQQKQQTLAELNKISQDSLAKQDFLQFQLQDLLALNLTTGEYANLNAEHKQLSHAGQIINTCQQVLTTITEHDKHALTHQLSKAIDSLQSLSLLVPELQNAIELLNNAIIQMSEASSEISTILRNINIDSKRLQWVEDRISKIYDLARKHQVKPDDIMLLQNKLQNELEQLQHAKQQSEQLTHELLKLEADYQKHAEKLTQSRNQAASQLNKRVIEQLYSLGMTNAEFYIKLIPFNEPCLTMFGNERIEFLFCANPGQSLQPLTKVASGGELSRIALSIDVITAQCLAIPIIIFDEIDAGIGGNTANKVGQLLQQLGQYAQVFCITHLPQVAAMAHNHFSVTKQVKSKDTRILVNMLNQQSRIEEVARMLGGTDLEHSLAYAKELLKYTLHA